MNKVYLQAVRLPISVPKSDKNRQVQQRKWSFLQSIDPKQRRLGIDKLDMQIISSMVESGANNTSIAKSVNRPLSTVQRRTRKLIASGFMTEKVEPNINAFGLRRALIVISLDGTKPEDVCNKLLEIDGIIQANAYVGSLDVLATAIFEDNRKVLEFISHAKRIDGVRSVTWSEEVYSVPAR